MKRAQQHGSYVDLTQGATENSTRKHILSNGSVFLI